MSRPFALACLAALIVAQPAQAAERRIYSYVPADADTKARIDSGLTFVFDKGLVGLRVREILATEAKAQAGVDPVSEGELGARLDEVLPAGSSEREIYLVRPENQGPAMVRAFCRGSTKGWLVLGRLDPLRGVRVHALGDDPATGKPRYCATLNLSFRGQWRLPPHQPFIMPGSDIIAAKGQ